MNGFRSVAPRVARPAALILLLTAVCAGAQAAPEVPTEPSEQVELVFFGVVTVRDGEYVLFQNPDLEGDALERAQRELAATSLGWGQPVTDEATPLLDRVRRTLRIGEPFDPLEKPDRAGSVPYRFYAVLPDQPVSLSEVQIDPDPQHGWDAIQSESCVAVECWLPEDVEDISLSAEYWFADDYEVIARLEGEQLKAGAAGRTTHGMKWRITDLAEKNDSISIGLETNITRQAERLRIRVMTPEGQPMPYASRMDSGSTRLAEDRIFRKMEFRFGDEDAASLGIIELSAPDPERVKKLSIRKFPVILKAAEEKPEPDEDNAGSEAEEDDAN
jgi:hypothetical protein